jgi:hypothetical protein
MKTVTRYWYSDPGHSWLKVKYSELEKLGIQCQISSFSYRNGDDVYLEEDCDAGKYIVAMNKAGKALNFKTRSYTTPSSRVRTYDPYCFTLSMGELIASWSKEVA